MADLTDTFNVGRYFNVFNKLLFLTKGLFQILEIVINSNILYPAEILTQIDNNLGDCNIYIKQNNSKKV